MDLAFVVIDKNKGVLEFAGAKNPMVLIQNNEAQHIKGDKFPIGGSEHGKDFVFTKSSFTITNDTYIYLYSDGYEDQLGGPDGRKFGRIRMMELLSGIYSKPFDEQKQICADTHIAWKGNENQLDDLLLIGLKI
jgi:serine phosphatase RsbU (regulator of sigma subunit)